jgi:hypothetical protein
MNHFKYILITLLLTLASSLSQAATSVGEVTLVIGEVSAMRPDGSSLPMKRGELIYAGDVLETADGGHVHVRFVDGALVSVRPSSRLVIEQYEESAGSRVAIKFKVEKGVVRSITGKWGQANPEKFRLNTPVAAIGVRGTDFVVKVDGDATQASVFTGAIAMSALTPECAQSLGPCDTADTLTLAADMKGVMLQLAPQQNASPVLTPAVDLLVRRIPNPEPVPSANVELDLQVAEDAGNTSMFAERLKDVIIAADKPIPVAADKPIPVAADKPIPVAADKPIPVAADKPIPVAADKVIENEGRSMVWLHNQFDWNVPSHTISERFTEALGSMMQPVAGNLFISLYRDETILKLYQPSATNQVSFNLKSVSAIYQPRISSGLPPEIAQVTKASLNVDFARSAYATNLEIASPKIGEVSINMAGNIDTKGRFVDRNANTSVAGALSQNGKEAGYMFNQAIGLGNLSGLTLWEQ